MLHASIIKKNLLCYLLHILYKIIFAISLCIYVACKHD